MSCSNTFLLFDKLTKQYKYDAFGHIIEFPCGVCENCKRDRISILEQRAKFEWRNNKYCAFIDLTYDNNHLEYNFGDNGEHILPTVSKKSFHKYIDNLRHYLKNHNIKNCNSKFSWLGCSEYGDSTFRPHYHIILFGVDFHSGYKFLNKLWKNGYVDVKPVYNGAIRYVLDYLEKQQKGENNDRMYFDRGINQPFVSWSKGFGSGFYKEHADEIAETGCIQIAGCRIPVPSYYKYKYIKFNWDNIEQMEFVKRQIKLQHKEIARSYGFHSINDYLKFNTLNRELNLISKKAENRKSIDCLKYSYVIRDMQNLKKRRFSTCPRLLV